MDKRVPIAAVLSLTLLASMILAPVSAAPPPISNQMQLYEARTEGDGPTTVDYSAANDPASCELLQNTMDTLIAFNGEHTDQFLPSIATSFNATTPGTFVNGIDVSDNNEAINWSEVAADPQLIKFAYARATSATDAGNLYNDTEYDANVVFGWANNIRMGAYDGANHPQNYSAVDAAKNFYKVIKDDLESNNFLSLPPALSIEQVDATEMERLRTSQWILTWSDTFFKLAKVQPIIYSSESAVKDFFNDTVKSRFRLWIANWTYNPDPRIAPQTGYVWNYWQYSNRGRVTGIDTWVDMNVDYFLRNGIDGGNIGDGTDSGNAINGLHFEHPESQPGPTGKNYNQYFFRITPGRVNFGPPYNYSLTPEDVAYSFQRTMIMDIAGGPQWMLQKLLLDNAGGDDASSGGIADLTNMTQVAELGALIRDSVQYNATHVWFNLMYPSANPPFLQILARTWSSIISKQWINNQVIAETGRPDWNGDWSSPTAWVAYHNPTVSPLDSPTPMLYGSGPFTLLTLDQAGQFWEATRNVAYWRGWPADYPVTGYVSPRPYGGYVDTIKCTWAFDWPTRKSMFLYGDVDFVDVPAENVPEMFQDPNPPYTPPNYPLDGIRAINLTSGFHFERDWVVGWYYNPVYPGNYFYNLWKWYYVYHALLDTTVQPYSYSLGVDINYDGDVDIKDVSTTAKSYGSNPEPPINPRWVFRADFNGDRTIDIKDVSSVAKRFGAVSAVWTPV